MRLGVRLQNLLRLVLRLENCLLQAKGLCSGLDIIFPSLCFDSGSGINLRLVLQCSRLSVEAGSKALLNELPFFST